MLIVKLGVSYHQQYTKTPLFTNRGTHFLIEKLKSGGHTLLSRHGRLKLLKQFNMLILNLGNSSCSMVVVHKSDKLIKTSQINTR